MSKIEWTDTTWNPVTGCTKVSAGCKHCYAETMAWRLLAMKNPRYRNGFNVTLHHDKIRQPLLWRTPRRVFVNSMSDLFHGDVPRPFILACFRAMLDAPMHTYQVLTKRSARMKKLLNHEQWPRLGSHIHTGVSVESMKVSGRLDDLCATTAPVKFVSCEPLLGPLDILPWLHGNIAWVIVGGESGPKARRMDPDWARGIRDQCRVAGVPFFMKQMGGHPNKRGALEDIPEDLRIREWPK